MNKKLQDELDRSVLAGHLEVRANGNYAFTPAGDAHAKALLKKDREARAFYREMNELYGFDADAGLPEWEGEGDE